MNLFGFMKDIGHKLFDRDEDAATSIKKHIEADEAEIDRLEGIGALNFLAIDDLVVSQEGEPVATSG